MVRKVYIPNKDSKDYSQLEKYGEKVFLTEGLINKVNISELYCSLLDKLEESEEDDLLMLGSMNIICCISAQILDTLHGRVNYLIYQRGTYTVRSVTVNLDPKEV